MTRSFLVPLSAVSLVAVALSACGSTPEGPRVTCPDVLLERSTADLVVFRDGPGRDLTDVVYEARLGGYTGDCTPAKDRTSVELSVQPTFMISKGPAWSGTTGTFSYFVAIPAFYPAPEGKKVYSVPFAFPPGNATSVVVRDEKVLLDIPVAAGRTKPPPVYLGFQLTPGQLEYNRTAGGR